MQVERGRFWALLPKPTLGDRMSAKLLPLGAYDRFDWFAGTLARPCIKAPEVSVLERRTAKCGPDFSRGQVKLQSTNGDVLSQALQQLGIGEVTSSHGALNFRQDLLLDPRFKRRVQRLERSSEGHFASAHLGHKGLRGGSQALVGTRTKHGPQGRNQPCGSGMGIDDPEAPLAGRVILLVEIGDGAHQDFPRSQRTAMRDFRQDQSGLFSRTSRNRGKGAQERGSSGT